MFGNMKGEIMKTVFITGASSGIGKETAILFQQRGWNVIATMRSPAVNHELDKLSNVEIISCDVTDVGSIQTAVEKGIKRFGNIDVLVNNAGYYLVGPLEAATSEQIQRQLDTNLLGVIETTRTILPYFRKNNSGIIINLSSIAGRVSIPLQSLYHATKFAIEGFSESLQYELDTYNIRIKLIEPGTIKTNFCGKSMDIAGQGTTNEYQEYSQKVLSNLIKNGNSGSEPIGVAKTIFKAATDKSNKMRYPTGKMKNMITMRKLLPLGIYRSIVKAILE